jgi:UDP-glucose 4-epimerase
MKKVLVTGGCGFIGTELCNQLIGDYDVTVADDLSKSRSSQKPGYTFRKLDLSDSKKTDKLFEEGNFDICLNLAARVGGVGYLNKHPAEILSTNNQIYSTTFESAVKYGLKRMVLISSAMALEEKDIATSSIYGFSKLIGEKYCKAFQEEYGLDYSICRPFNIFGINDFPESEVGFSHVIPDLVKKILESKGSFEILGDGQQKRCFTYLPDLARGIIKVMESDKAVNEDFNISVKEETTIKDLAKIIWEICKPGEPFNPTYVQGFSSDSKTRIPDVSKIERLLGWSPEASLNEGLRETINWLRSEIGK